MKKEAHPSVAHSEISAVCEHLCFDPETYVRLSTSTAKLALRTQLCSQPFVTAAAEMNSGGQAEVV